MQKGNTFSYLSIRKWRGKGGRKEEAERYTIKRAPMCTFLASGWNSGSSVHSSVVTVSIYYYDHYLRNSIVCFHNACLFDFPFATRMYDFPNSQQTEKNPTSHAHILVNPTSWEAVKSRFLSRYFVFFRIPLCILVNSQIPKIPFPNPVLRVTLSKSAYVFDVLLKY